MSALELSPQAARTFALQATGLIRPHHDVQAALAHHGYIQIDPINICGRMQDLILRPRVAGYREGDLIRHLHGQNENAPLASQGRNAFEHHLPATGILVALELEAWPHLQAVMRAHPPRRSMVGTAFAP